MFKLLNENESSTIIQDADWLTPVLFGQILNNEEEKTGY